MPRPYLRIVCFDDESGGTLSAKVAQCAEELRIGCIFRHYPDDWLRWAEQEGREQGPMLWLVDLLSKADRGRTQAWERINGWRDDDKKLDELLSDPAIQGDLRNLSQGLAVLLYASKQLRTDSSAASRQKKIGLRVCSNFAPDLPTIRPLIAYAATGEVTGAFEGWGVDKLGLIDESDEERHLKALKGLSLAVREMAFPKVEPLQIPEAWPSGLHFLYPAWQYVRHNVVTVAFGGLLLTGAGTYLAYAASRQKAPTFEKVLFTHKGDNVAHCVLGTCGQLMKLEKLLEEGDSVEVEGSITDDAHIVYIAIPKTNLPDTREDHEFRVELPSLRGRWGLNFIAILTSRKNLNQKDLLSIEDQLGNARAIESLGSGNIDDPEAFGPFVCDGMVSPNKGGSQSISRACEILGEFISKDSRNRHALLVAFPVKFPEPRPIK